MLTKAVDIIFSVQVEVAKNIFEARVEDQLDDIYGWTRLDDMIFGADTEAIDAVFRREKKRFLTTMKAVLDQIAALIATSLNAAIARIETGRQEAKTFFDGLTKKQQGLSQEAYQIFQLQFNTLEDSVRAKEQELADTLTESYRSGVDSLQESFDKIKEDVSRGWIGGAIDFIEGAAEVIEKLGELLYSVLSRIANVVGDILAHPIRFIENLASGVGAGFAQFTKNIDEYLVTGFFEWLRGSAGPAIKLPEKLDAAGLFDLTAQILGLTYETFRKVAVKVWGKAAVELLETGAAAAEKGLEIVQIVHQKGLGELWELIQASLSSLVEELIQKVKETVLFAAIDKALAFIAGLFTPVGAFIKAAQAIYRGIRFLMDNIDRITEIVDAFLTSVELAVAGNTDAIAQKIVNALRGFIVVGIDFLAKLLGLGDLAGKVHKILNAIRAPFERAIEVVLKRLTALVRAVMRKLGLGPRGEKDQPAQKRTAEERKKAAEPKRAAEPLKTAEESEKTKDIEKQREWLLSHSEVITQVFSAMSKPTQAKRPAAALAEKQEQAQALVKEYQPLLKQGRLRITITDSGAKEVEEHAAVDFDVSASPGRTGQAPVAVDKDLEEAKNYVGMNVDLADQGKQIYRATVLAINEKTKIVKLSFLIPQGGRQKLARLASCKMSEFLGAVRTGKPVPGLELMELKHTSKFVINVNGKFVIDLKAIDGEWRRTFYGDYNKAVEDEKKRLLTSPYTGDVRNGISDPADSKLFIDKRRYWARGDYVDPKQGNRYKPTIEHNPAVVDHWNDKGRRVVHKIRTDAYNKIPFEILPWSRNSSEGAKKSGLFKPEVGPDFRGPGE